MYNETKLSDSLHATRDNDNTVVLEELWIIVAFKGTVKRAVEPLNSIFHNAARGAVGSSSEAWLQRCTRLESGKSKAQLGKSVDHDIAKLHIIEIPLKVSLPKVKSIYAPEAKYDDID